MKIQFLGATSTVTGSRYLLTHGSQKILVDCGLFQGYKNLRLKNREPFPIAPSELSAVVLTHAHLDHSGYIPLLVKNGFKGPIYCTAATRDLCSLLLPDSGYLQEEEAKFANHHSFSKHRPALPLYTEEDARLSLKKFVTVNWREQYSFGSQTDSVERFTFELHPAGHLFGAASILIRYGNKSIAFSGDIGRRSDPVTRNPDFNIGADTLVVESTYGDRVHSELDPQNKIAEIIRKTMARGGTLLIPSFAVGRAQIVLYYIRELKLAGRIPEVPIYLNSPMAMGANVVFSRHYKESKVSFDETHSICEIAKPIASVEESIALNESRQPKIIIAASGMATGGRVLHHLKAFAPDPKNTILFVGFQAGGTRGEAILHGAKEVKIHGEFWPIRAEVAEIDSMSAHADSNGVMEWVRQLQRQPSRIFVTHGEPAAADALRRRLEGETHAVVRVPDFAETIDLDLP